MNILNKIIDRYIEDQKEKNSDSRAFLDANIFGKSSKEISDFLICTAPDEIGGLTAITGFYYQFLVAIEYIIEMLEGQWDFVFFEHHDDVVVGKNNKIRFVQVKTSQNVKVNVSSAPASGLYKRSPKDVKGTMMKRNDSWVDKLLSKAELLKKEDGYITQFQLYASYHFVKTDNFDFDIYTGNKKYDMVIPLKDKLLSKINEIVVDRHGNEYDYSVNCGEQTSDLLSRLYLHTGPTLQEIENFRNYLCIKLNKWIFKDVGDNISMKTDDIYSIIGYLCTECTYRDSSERLLITPEKIENILKDIRERSLASANYALERHGSKIITRRVIDSLVLELENSTHSNYLKDKLYSYREYFEEWLESGGSIRSLFERYVEGTSKTAIYSKLSDSTKDQRLQDFFCIVLFLLIVRSSSLEFSDTTGLLIKEGSPSNLLFSFLSLETRNNFSNGVQKLEAIIQQADINDQLFLLDKKIQIIFQNYSDRKFTNKIKKELKSKPIVDLDGIENLHLLNEVTLSAEIFPGNLVIEEFYECLNDEEPNFQIKIQEIWNRFQSEV